MDPVVGTVAALSRFPVKSMGGEALEEVAIGWAGLAGDRQWAFVGPDRSSRFPFFTGRDHAPLLPFRARYVDVCDPKTSPVEVTAPDGRTYAIGDDELRLRLEAAGGMQLRLLRLGRGLHDAMPVSLVSTAGHCALEEAHGAPVDPRRFRINIRVETDMPMRVWAGRRLRFGGEHGPELLVAEAIERCVMITIDPDSGVRDTWLMRTVARQFGNKYGVYASVGRPGLLRAGADVRLCD